MQSKSLLPELQLDEYITISPDNGMEYNPGETVNVSVTVSPDSPEVDTITITVSGSALETPESESPVTTTCDNTRSCSMDVTLANTGETNIEVAVDYGCSVWTPDMRTIRAGKPPALILAKVALLPTP